MTLDYTIILKIEANLRKYTNGYMDYRAQEVTRTENTRPGISIDVYTDLEREEEQTWVTDEIRGKLKKARKLLCEKFEDSFEKEKDLWLDYIYSSYNLDEDRLFTVVRIYKYQLDEISTDEEIDKLINSSFSYTLGNFYNKAVAIRNLKDDKCELMISIERYVSDKEWKVNIRYSDFSIYEFKESKLIDSIRDKWKIKFEKKIKAIKDKIRDNTLAEYGHAGWNYSTNNFLSEEEFELEFDKFVKDWVIKED